jgi:chemotaxis-related protein WspD
MSLPDHTAIDCWNRIGVMGDQSCEQLQRVIHCRNCEVYAAAAQTFLQRPVDEGYRKEWAAHFRAPAGAGGLRPHSGLVFRVGREWLSLPTSIFVSVAPEARPHRLPHRNARGLTGIVNVGGTLYPCMSLAALLDIEAGDVVAAHGRHIFPRLLLMQWEEQAYALPVQDLHGIVRYADSEVKAPAATINKGLSRFLTGVISDGDMRIGLLDAALVGYQLERILR